MACKRFMGYEIHLALNQLGIAQNVWLIGGHGLREVWVRRGSTVVRRKQSSTV